MSGEEGVSTPGWVRDLERRRQQPHKLAHDVGAGAPCLTCVDACPGLDLHFWRKACKNCKCSKEKHDVIEENGYHHFEILLGAQNQTPSSAKYGLGKDEAGNILSFDWVPPGIPAEVAEQYMLGIPEHQRPISGTEGAQRRREQLERQVPPHDLDPTKCHSLSAEEVVGLENYRQHLKEGVVGQGRVATLAAMLKDMGLSYGALAKDGSIILGHPTGAPEVNDTITATPIATRTIKEEDETNDNDEMFPPPPSPQTLANLEPPQFPPPGAPNNFLKRPSAYLPIPYGPPRNVGVETAAENANPVTSQEFATPMKARGQQQTFELKTPMAKGINIADVQTPANVPMKFANVANKATRIENNNLEGELPAELAGLQFNDKDEIDEGKCMECNLPVSPGDVVVTAERAGTGAFWHPACFVCCTCKELLVDLIYFHKGTKLFCGRHFAEEVNIPRCHACDELIFTTEYTLAEEKYFHVRHFCCIECDTPLAGLKYISRGGQPCCLACYELKFSKVCNTCKKVIGPCDSSVIWHDIHWHATNQCFCCFNCKKTLLNTKFAVKENQSLCSKECIQEFLKNRVAVTDL